MEKSQIYLLSLIRSSPGYKLTQREITNKVREDIFQKKGPYLNYSESYRMTRFNKDISELVSKGLLNKMDEKLEMPQEIVQFLDKLPKPVETTKDNIQAKLHELLNNGHALKLEIMRLISEDKREIRVKLKDLTWSEKAIESALKQLSSENIITSDYKPKICTNEFQKEITGFFKNYRDAIVNLSLDKRDEAERLQVMLSPYVKRYTPTTSLKAANLVLDFLSELKNKKIEVVSVDFSRLRMIFNQKLYEISNIEEEVTDIPYSDADKALFICNKIHPVFVKNFCAEFNAERRRKYAVYNLRTLDKFDFAQDSLFNMFEGFLQKRFNLSFTVSNKVFDETQRIVDELHQNLQKEKEESAKKKTIDEGFLYAQIHIPWALGTKIEEFFKKSKSVIRISNPYIDNSTFHLLQAAGPVKILMLVTPDRRLETKVSQNKVSKKEVQKILEKKRIEIKVIPNLHARFIIVDEKLTLFLSSDLQTDSLTSKYQYGSWTNNSDIVQSCIHYFDSMWNDADPYDVIREIDTLERKRKS